MSARWTGGALSIAVGVVAWHLLARRVGPILLATPGDVVHALVLERSRLLEATLHTALAGVGGLLLAVLLGVTAAMVAWASRALGAALVPYTILLQVVPIVAIAPMLVVWLGYGTPVALTTALIAAFYPVYAAASTGLRAPTQDLVDLFHLYGATTAQELLLLRLPFALPALFAGLRTAAGLAVIGAIVGEFVGSNGAPPTLGWLVVFAARGARSDLCFAAIACAALLALALHGVLRYAERRAIGHWYGA